MILNFRTKDEVLKNSFENKSLIYVGHTTNCKQRKAQHKNNCNNESNKKFNLKLYAMLRENGGF